jgi:hypothetical protein
MVNQIIFGILAVALGTVALKFNFQLVNTTGNVGFFEKVLGPGGTYLGFKILSLLLILGGFLYTTGLHTPILDMLVEPLSPFLPKNIN